MNSEFLGHVLIENGRTAEVWLEWGRVGKSTFGITVKFIDSETKQIVRMENLKDALEDLNIERLGAKDISRELRKLIKPKRK